MKLKSLIAASALFLMSVGVPPLANASLVDRGGGLIYDTVLNVTWLQDANYAKTSGYDADGTMDMHPAQEWVENLSYFDNVRGVSWEGWRLPAIAPINGTSFNFVESYTGNTDVGYNMGTIGTSFAGSTSSEMAYMFYVNLANQGFLTTLGTYSACYPDCLTNTGPFTNLKSSIYWVGAISTNQAGWLATNSGYQGVINESTVAFYAWAVRDGDVAAALSTVPEPATYTMLLAGLGLMGFTRRSRNGLAAKLQRQQN